ncbi:MAG: hypothetical protein JXR73_19315 [Candidatus Omnitrophica bacterium]|nr:hypothetical protein [Candidatus Omnitrophota bacterium]
MSSNTYDLLASWRNYQRLRFIKGFYAIRKLVQDLFYHYEQSGDISHEKINILLEKHLRELRSLSDTLYHMPDDENVDRKKQRGFDKVLSELWHELDKTRDNIRIIDAYTEEQTPAEDKVFKALNRLDKQIVNQARRNLPLQLRHARRIIDILVPLFEQILPIYQSNFVLLRTLYFYRAELDPLCPPSTAQYFFPIIFGSVEKGYLELIQSLVETKHMNHAESVLHEFKEWIEKNSKNRALFEKAEYLVLHPN